MLAALILSVAFASSPLEAPMPCDTIMVVDTLYRTGNRIVADTNYYSVCPLNCSLTDLKKDVVKLRQLLKARKGK